MEMQTGTSELLTSIVSISMAEKGKDSKDLLILRFGNKGSFLGLMVVFDEILKKC